MLDRDREAALRAAQNIRGLALACEATSGDAVAAVFSEVARIYGGMDILVFNAGAAWQGKIGEVDEALLHAVDYGTAGIRSNAVNADRIRRGCSPARWSRRARRRASFPRTTTWQAISWARKSRPTM